MKTALSITLVICGTIVAAIPAMSHAWDAFMISMTLTHLPQGGTATFHAMDDNYQFGCYILGAAMIGVSIYSSFASRTATDASRLKTAVA